MGLRHRHAQDRSGAPHGHGVPDRRRGLRSLAQDDRPAGRQDRAHRRQAWRRLRQLLADGRNRPLRSLHRNLLRPRRAHPGRTAGLARRRRRPLGGDLEPGVHAVRPLGRRQAHAAAEAVRGHRRRSRARVGGDAGRHQQLRHRHLRRSHPRGREVVRHHRAHEPEPARDRGSHPRLQLPHRRRRGAVERRPRLRAAPHRAPRHAPRPQVRQEPDVLQRAGAHAGQGDGRGVSRAGRRNRRACATCCSRKANSSRARSRPAWSFSTRPSRSSAPQDHRRRDGLQALRHLRLPRRSHQRHRARARAGHRQRRLRSEPCRSSASSRRPPASSAWT